MNLRTTVFSKMLRCVIRITDDVSIPLTTVDAVILKWWSMHMSQIHHMVGQILDHGGETPEVMSKGWTVVVTYI